MENILALRLKSIKFGIEKKQAQEALKTEKFARDKDEARFLRTGDELFKAGYMYVPRAGSRYGMYVDLNGKPDAGMQKLGRQLEAQDKKIKLLESNLKKIQSNINQCSYDVTQARIRNAQDIMNMRDNASRKLRKAGKATVDFVSDFCQNGYDSVKRNINNYKADKQNDLKDLDKLTDYILTGGKTVAHSRAVAQRGAHFIEKSELDGGLEISVPANYKGHKVNATVASYDHYDKFSNSADIDLNPPVKRTYGTSKGLTVETFNSVTVVLDADGKIDFSNPANSAVLSEPGAMTQILKKYPESFGTIPRDRLKDDKIYQAYSQATKDGAELKAQKEPYPGVDENGNALDKTEYLKRINKMGKAKKLEVENAKASDQEFGKDW